MLKQKTFILLFSLLLLFTPIIAQGFSLIPCGGYSTASTAPCTVGDFFYLVARVTNWLISLGGLYAVVHIVISGFKLVLSQGNEEAVKKAREGITNAILGFVLILAAFLIVNTVVTKLVPSKCPIKLSDPATYLSCS